MSDKVKPDIRYALELMLGWATLVPDEMLDGDPEYRRQYLDDIQTAHLAIKYLFEQERSK